MVELRDVLITNAPFHPGDVGLGLVFHWSNNGILCGLDVSYVQWMNDIVSHFLSVSKTEVETYWSLDRHIDKIKDDFIQEMMSLK